MSRRLAGLVLGGVLGALGTRGALALSATAATDPRVQVVLLSHRVTRHARFSATGRYIRAMMRHVVGRRFHVGARVIFSVTEPGHRSARSEAIIRRGASPRSRVLR